MKKSTFIASLIFLFFASACTSPVTTSPTQTSLPPTVTPTFTTTYTETPTMTTTPIPSGPCDNPLVPLVTGSSYEYQVTTSAGLAMFTLNIGERKDVGNINIEVHLIDHKHRWDIKELVICDAGEIVNFPLYVMSMLMTDSFESILNTYHYHESAPYAPAFPVLAETDWFYTWEPGYQLEENVILKNPMGGANLFMSGMSPIDVTFFMDGKWETVDLLTGLSAQALEIKVDYHMVATIIQEAAGCSVDLHTTQWYVPFVGLVRAKVDSTEMKYAGQTFQAEISSLLELIGFTPAP